MEVERGNGTCHHTFSLTWSLEVAKNYPVLRSWKLFLFHIKFKSHLGHSLSVVTGQALELKFGD